MIVCIISANLIKYFLRYTEKSKAIRISDLTIKNKFNIKSSKVRMLQIPKLINQMTLNSVSVAKFLSKIT